MPSSQPIEMSTLEFHVLLALANGPLYGYAVSQAVMEESSGALTPRAGSLYRVLARLLTAGFARVARAGDDAEPHPGLARRYYELTRDGRRALATESQRLRHSVRMAEQRLGLRRGHS